MVTHMAAGWPSNQEEYADVLKETDDETITFVGLGGIFQDSDS